MGEVRNFYREVEVSSDFEVSGHFVRTVEGAISMEILREEYLKRYGFNNLKPDRYYSLEVFLGLLRDLEKDFKWSLKFVGRNIPRYARMPEGIDSFEKALEKLNDAYYMNHRTTNGESLDIGVYSYEKIADDEYVITSTGPYPCDFDAGIIEGIAKRFGKIIRITHGEGCREEGNDSCSYHIKILK